MQVKTRFRALDYLIGRNLKDVSKDLNDFGLNWHVYELNGYLVADGCGDSCIGVSIDLEGKIEKIGVCSRHHKDLWRVENE